MNGLTFRCLLGCALLAIFPAYGKVPGSQFTSFAGFNLGEVTLGQIADKLGAAKLVETGDGAEYEASICYRTPFGLIYFLSGEMAGPDNELIGFGINASDVENARPCARWPSDRLVPDLSLAGVSLGMSKAAFEKAVAADVRWEHDVAYVAFRGKRFMTQEEIDSAPKDIRQAIQRGATKDYIDVDVTLMATFRDGRLVEFQSWKIESQ